jgi:hypothetical protein
MTGDPDHRQPGDTPEKARPAVRDLFAVDDDHDDRSPHGLDRVVSALDANPAAPSERAR